MGIGNTGIALHLVPYLVDSGISSTVAVGAVSVNFLSSAASTLVWGFLADKYSPRYLLTFTLVLRTLAIGLLLISDSVVEAYAFSILQGITEAGMITLVVVLLADYFGRQNLGSIFGINRTAQVAGFAIGPIFAGLVFDVTGSYVSAFVTFLVLAIIATILIPGARPPAKQTAIM
jgi:MFS family permease